MEILAILGCGGQYTKVIDRKIRELGVRTEIYPIIVETDKLKDVGGIIHYYVAKAEAGVYNKKNC